MRRPWRLHPVVSSSQYLVVAPCDDLLKRRLHQTVTFNKICLAINPSFQQKTTNITERSWACGLRIKTKIRLILICSDLQVYQVYTFHCWQGADNCISSHFLRGHPIRGRYSQIIVSCLPHFNHPGWPKQCLCSFRFSYLRSLGLIRQSPISSWTMIVKWSQGALTWMIVMDWRSPNQMTVEAF